ncbi:MAG: hypothetical protein ACKOA9_14445 [Actinomycetota bacterium]
MWAVMTTVSVPAGADPEYLRRSLEEGAVPAVRALADLRSATWTLTDDHATGTGFYVFATEDAARARAAIYAVGAAAPGGATITAVTVLAILAHVEA